MMMMTGSRTKLMNHGYLLLLLTVMLSQRATNVCCFLGTTWRRRVAFQSKTALEGGYGVATNYTWTEEPFEMEVTVSVPPETRSKDIQFKATPTSIDLRLDDSIVLLNGTRKMRGRISLDGTFWVISDSDNGPTTTDRKVTVTIEKAVKAPKDDFEIVDYDWRGVYPDDDDEVSERKYEESEELDVREYAASMGVDIDNINMAMVDKTMFSSGLNLTRSTFDELTKAGYAKEVTQQTDGTEFTINDNGESVAFSKLGDGISQDEMKEATADLPKIPFLDTNSPWHKTVPVDELTEGRQRISPDPIEEEVVPEEEEEEVNGVDSKTRIGKDKASDPIDALTVKRLKEILRAQGLKVSGSKQDLRDRLRGHVQVMAADKSKASGENIKPQ